MNCKPGDLAVIVSARGAEGFSGDVARASIGRIARVTTYGPPRGEFGLTVPNVWQFEHPLDVVVRGKSVLVIGCADQELRPIRGGDGADETIEWAGKPRETETVYDVLAEAAEGAEAYVERKLIKRLSEAAR